MSDQEGPLDWDDEDEALAMASTPKLEPTSGYYGPPRPKRGRRYKPPTTRAEIRRKLRALDRAMDDYQRWGERMFQAEEATPGKHRVYRDRLDMLANRIEQLGNWLERRDVTALFDKLGQG